MRIGLRLQILAAIAVLLAAAFVPLWRAIASVTEEALVAEVAARSREVAELLADSAETTGQRLELARVHARPGLSLCLFGADGVVLDSFGPATCTTLAAARATRGAAVVVRPRSTLVAWESRHAASSRAQSVVRLARLYTVLFAIALLAFAFGAITWLVVRPIEALAVAAQRVQRGAVDFVVPAGGARELTLLAQHLRSMTESLRENERLLATKVTELTQTTGYLTTARHELAEGERLASVGRLAAGVAHEIGNPLTAIFGLADLLVEGGLS
ncbi:MAG: HAMP domain-containing protein, partial [Proteobacteria bacterium]